MKGNLESLTKEELVKKHAALKEEIRQLRFQFAVERALPQPKRIREAKRDVARILTVLNQRARAEKQV